MTGVILGLPYSFGRLSWLFLLPMILKGDASPQKAIEEEVKDDQKEQDNRNLILLMERPWEILMMNPWAEAFLDNHGVCEIGRILASGYSAKKMLRQTDVRGRNKKDNNIR